MKPSLLVRAIWFGWLASCVLVESRPTSTRFYEAFFMGTIMLGLVPVSGICALVSWKRMRWRGLTVPAISLALFVVAFLGSLMWGATPPAHDALGARFRAHRLTYETLRNMMEVDGLSAILNYGLGAVYAKGSRLNESYGADIGLSPERTRTYQQLMWEANCERIDRAGDGSVQFSMAGWGMLNKGWRMNLLWTKTAPEPLLANIDQFRKTSSRWEEAYSRLDQDWYLGMIW